MLTNLLLILFLVLMSYVWATFQGFFSAFIQLVIVIAAGSLALALWEPLTLKFLFEPLGDYAWGLGLLGPFLFLTAALRAIFSQVMPRTVSFFSLFDTIGGAVCGLLSGILVAGLTLVGIGFLPLPSDFGGVQALRVDDHGQVVAGESGLWLPVDHYAIAFFNRVSAGSLRSSRPLRTHQPDLDRQANLFRLRPSMSNRLTVTPNDVYLIENGRYQTRPLPVKELDPAVVAALGPEGVDLDNQLVAVNTRWHRQDHIADTDRKLRIFPTQIRLISWDHRGATGYAQLHAPLAASHAIRAEGSPQETHRFVPFNHAGASIVEAGSVADVTFLFIVPADRSPRKILLRNLRLDLADEPEPLTNELLPSLVGELPPPASPQTAAPSQPEPSSNHPPAAEPVAARQTPAPAAQPVEDPAVATTARLPRPIAASRIAQLELRDDNIASGEQFIAYQGAELDPGDRWIDSIATPDGVKLVRVKIEYRGAQSGLGRMREMALLLGPLALMPDGGQPIVPIAYVWLRPDGSQQIKVEPLRMFRSAQELPVRQAGEGDALYVYYPVAPGVRVTSVQVSNRTLVEFSHTVQ